MSIKKKKLWALKEEDMSIKMKSKPQEWTEAKVKISNKKL